MPAQPITTDHGTTVDLVHEAGETVVVLSAEDAPTNVAGRLVYDGTGFQPAPFAPFAMRPDVLRAIADLIEANTEGGGQ